MGSDVWLSPFSGLNASSISICARKFLKENENNSGIILASGITVLVLWPLWPLGVFIVAWKTRDVENQNDLFMHCAT